MTISDVVAVILAVDVVATDHIRFLSLICPFVSNLAPFLRASQF